VPTPQSLHAGLARLSDRPARVENVARLDPEELRLVTVLVERATEVDGVRPLSDAVTRSLAAPGASGVRHLLVHRPGPDGPCLAGYAHLDGSDPVTGVRAELVVDPTMRRAGVARVLLGHLGAGARDGRLLVSAHGDLEAARATARRLGFRPWRHLQLLASTSTVRLARLPAPEPSVYVDRDDVVALRSFLRRGYLPGDTCVLYRRSSPA